MKRVDMLKFPSYPNMIYKITENLLKNIKRDLAILDQGKMILHILYIGKSKSISPSYSGIGKYFQEVARIPNASELNGRQNLRICYSLRLQCENFDI